MVREKNYANKLFEQYDSESRVTCMATNLYGTHMVSGARDGDLQAHVERNFSLGNVTCVCCIMYHYIPKAHFLVFL